MKYQEKITSKLYNYFNQRLSLKRSTRGWKRSDCIYCGGKHTMGLHFKNGVAHCFRDNCLEHKTLVHLLMDMEHLPTIQEAWAFLKVQDEYEHFDKVISIGEKEVKRTQVKLPDGFHLLNMGDSIIDKAAQRYIKKRKFNIDKLARKGVGYCTTGEYAGYIIFPIYEKGQLIFYQGRRFTSLGTKMKNPSYEDFGIGKTELMYNADALYIYNTCYLVESITNAETIGDRAIASLGKKLSEFQIRKILNSPCQNLIIALDPDAIEEAIKLALTFSMYKRVKLLELPEGEDVNSIGKRLTMEIVKNTPWGDYNYYFRLKLDFCARANHSHN